MHWQAVGLAGVVVSCASGGLALSAVRGGGWAVSMRGCRLDARGARAGNPRGCVTPSDVGGPCTVETRGGWPAGAPPTSQGIDGGVFRLGRKSAALGAPAMKPRSVLAAAVAATAAGVVDTGSMAQSPVSVDAGCSSDALGAGTGVGGRGAGCAGGRMCGMRGWTTARLGIVAAPGLSGNGRSTGTLRAGEYGARRLRKSAEVFWVMRGSDCLPRNRRRTACACAAAGTCLSAVGGAACLPLTS